MNTFSRALKFFRPDAPRIAVVLALLALGVGANLLKPWPVAIAVDYLSMGTKRGDTFPVLGQVGAAKGLAVLALAVLLFHVCHGTLSAAQNYLAIGVGLRGLTRVRNEIFACLQRLSLRFHQGARSGDLIQRAAWDTYSFQTLFQQGFVTSITASLTLLLMVLVMLRVSGPLTLVALATMPLLVLAIRLFGREMRARGAAAQAADSLVTSHVQQSIAALPLIQSYTREEQEGSRFAGHAVTAEEKRLSQHGWELLYWLGVTVAFGLGTAATVWVGSVLVIRGELTVGQLLVFLAYLAQLYEPLNQLSHVGATVSTAAAGAQRVFEILDTPEEVKDIENAKCVMRKESDYALRITHHASAPLIIHGEISFDQVSFSYQQDRDILRDLSFTLKPGESAALIGPSGVGKTTLLNLIPRFFDASSGAVKLDGADLRELRLRDLRAHVAVVLQEPILMPTTVAENIAYGKPGASRAEIEAAAKSANADGFIQKLPQRYDTVIGEGAARLSVGEKQRLNLARAFLKDAPILLLDEPTSALDAESEALVVASLNELKRGRTTLIVAHRLSTIRCVDKVLVLEDGRLTQMGSPAELAERGGYYARVANGQEVV